MDTIIKLFTESWTGWIILGMFVAFFLFAFIHNKVTKGGKLFSFLLIAAAMSYSTSLMAQVTGDSAFEDLLSYIEPVYMFLVLIAGYLADSVPFISKIPKIVYRVFALAVVAATIFVSAGWADGASIVITYLLSTNVYTHLLKQIFGKSSTKDN